MQMIMQMCRNNGGIGFWTGNPNADIPGIRIIPDSDEAWIWKISIVTKRDNYISDNMKAFIECFSNW
jgi:DNA-binding transcriptional LysR family regulator